MHHPPHPPRAPRAHDTAVLTGDTDYQTMYDNLADASIIFTTPEKWDVVTGRWKDHQALIGQVALLMLDEIHCLNEDRGGTLEAVVCRMKTVSRAPHVLKKSWPASRMRFVAVSATMPNVDDVGEWLGCPKSAIFKFGDEYRPAACMRAGRFAL